MLSISADNIAYQGLKSKGLSINRNNCLFMAKEEVNLIADDDLEYIDGFEEVVLGAFREIDDADIVLFEEIGKKFRCGEKKKLNYFSSPKSTSYLIAFKKSSLKNKKVNFDENFGVNAKYCLGEENIFLRDTYKAGLNIYYYPAVILRHSNISTGYR